MRQAYHSNAKTNEHSRGIIQQSNSTNKELAKRFGINKNTSYLHFEKSPMN